MMQSLDVPESCTNKCIGVTERGDKLILALGILFPKLHILLLQSPGIAHIQTHL